MIRMGWRRGWRRGEGSELAEEMEAGEFVELVDP